MGDVKDLGEYAITGGPGRPKGMKNKATQMRERLLAALDEVNEHLKADDPEAKSWLAQRFLNNDPELDKFLIKLIPEAKELDVDQHSTTDPTGAAKLAALPPLERLMAMRDLLDNHIRAMAPPPEALPPAENE